MIYCYSKHHKIPCVINSGSTISLLPLKFARIVNVRMKYIKPIKIGQAKGNLKVNKVYYLGFKDCDEF